ncbi:MAG: MCE family protein [Sphingobium sp.]|uniref:MlaD family protein n=1 Tax=Sphingobium sp. TaxID=1912891 RepID=UPI000DAFFDDA|nr:MlaD family protein [Sphingobium sp.]PZU06797.1 MAG: MCE family protein [Sphingobium sp.]
MERHANYALVGVLTTFLVIGGIVFVLWLGNFQAGDKKDPYRIVFQGPVRGVGKGGEVQFNGIKVGEVTAVRLAPQDASKIMVDVDIDHDTPVRTDSLGSTEMQGISGLNAVSISAGSTRMPLLRDVSKDKVPIIPSKPNALASLLKGGGQMVESATTALDQVNKLLTDRNIANLSGVMSDLKQTSGELAANRAMFGNAASAIAKLNATASDARATMGSVRSLVDGDGKRAVANAADAAEELKATIVQARAVLATLAVQGKTIGSSTLPQIADTMRSLQDTSDDLDALVRSIRQDPRGALLKKPSRERELQK